MVSDILGTRPKSAAEELRLESADRAEHLFERSKLVCKIVVPVALALVLTRLALPAAFKFFGETPVSLISIVGISAFALLVSLANFWSGRVHRDEARDRYANYASSKR